MRTLRIMNLYFCLSGLLFADTEVTRVQLDNGLTVILVGCEDCETVAVEAIYRIGLVNEPKDCAQISHLLEHMVCLEATRSYGVGESFQLLQKKGMVNAETLADWTHYDYILPAKDIELVLKVESERMRSLRISEEMVRSEAANCLREVDIVEKSPQAGMLKFAWAALNQVRVHGAEEAKIRGDLQSVSAIQVKEFYQQNHRPENAVQVIVGGFDKKKMLELVNEYFAKIPKNETKELTSDSLINGPKHRVAKWDSTTKAMFICFPAPDPKEKMMENLALTYLGDHLFKKLRQDQEIKESVNAVFCTNHLWNLRTLPFFVYATIKQGVKTETVKQKLMAHIQGLRSKKPSIMEMAMLKASFNMSVNCHVVNKKLTPWGVSFDLVLGNAALKVGMRELIFEGDYKAPAQKFNGLNGEDMVRIAHKYLDPDKSFITILEPGS